MVNIKKIWITLTAVLYLTAICTRFLQVPPITDSAKYVISNSFKYKTAGQYKRHLPLTKKTEISRLHHTGNAGSGNITSYGKIFNYAFHFEEYGYSFSYIISNKAPPSLA